MPPTEPGSNLRLYRGLLLTGGLVLMGVGAVDRLADPGTIDPLAGRLAVGLAAVALATLTFTSRWVRDHALPLTYAVFFAASAWQLGLAYANDFSPSSALGVLLVFIGCSAGFQRPLLLETYSFAFVAGAAAAVLALDAPGVPAGPFLLTLVALALLGTFLLRSRLLGLQRIEAARAEALAAARSKSEFLATMSHEIRTPLNGVIGMADLLAATALSDEQRDYADTIRTSGDALLAIINDVLDVSKLDAGRVELDPAPFDLRAFVEEAVDVVAPGAEAKGLDLIGHVRPAAVRTVVGDATRLRQILLNLLSNAVKFTDSGSVSVVVDLGEAAPGRARVEIRVQDTGPGLAADQVERVFSEFVQADPSTTRRYGGTGLGLAISRRLADLMGGRVWVETEPGAGATFVVEVELGLVGEPAAAAPALGEALVVAPHPVRRARLADLAAEAGFRPTAVAEPDDALAALDGGLRPRVVVAGFDGARALTRRLAAAGVTAPVLGVALSSARPLDGSAFDAVVPRPVRSGRFLAALAQLMSAGERERVEPVAPRTLPRLLHRVLVAEDHLVNRQVAVGLLRHLGIEADVAGTGRAALRAVHEGARAARPYDVVLMDVQMPEMDGLEATRRIRAEVDPDRQPRIVALTANALADDAGRCLAAGMDAYLAKPVRLDALRDALDAAPPRPARSAPPATGTFPDAVAIVAHLRALGSGDDVFVSEILAAYLRSDEDLLPRLAGPAAQAAEAAHKVRAASGTFGADGLAQRAATIERQAGQGVLDVDAIRSLIDDLLAFREAVAAAHADVTRALDRTTA